MRMPWTNWSLRQRLSMASGLVAATAVAGIGLAAILHLRVQMVRTFDDELQDTARSILLDHLAGSPPGNPFGQGGSVASKLIPVEFVEIEQPEGTVVFRSHHLEKSGLPTLDRQAAGGDVVWQGEKLRWVKVSEGRSVARVAASRHLVDATFKDVVLAFALAIPVVLVAAVLGAGWLVRRSFAPVESIHKAAAEITAENPGKRLPVLPGDDELARLSRVLNSTFERLDRAIRQATRFAGDASHELRTPLTLMRAEIETALNDPRMDPGCQGLLARLLEHQDRLSSIADSLLLLSRADAGRLLEKSSRFDLAVVLGELEEDLRALARGLVVEFEVTGPAPVDGDMNLLRQVFYNLFDNAVKYNRADGRIRVRLETAGPGGLRCVLVGNTGAGLRPGLEEDIFGRFVRSGEARGRAHGSGLGLSLSREIARAHGGDIVVAVNEADWTEFLLTLPCAEL